MTIAPRAVEDRRKLVAIYRTATIGAAAAILRDVVSRAATASRLVVLVRVADALARSRALDRAGPRVSGHP